MSKPKEQTLETSEIPSISTSLRYCKLKCLPTVAGPVMCVNEKPEAHIQEFSSCLQKCAPSYFLCSENLLRLFLISPFMIPAYTDLSTEEKQQCETVMNGNSHSVSFVGKY